MQFVKVFIILIYIPYFAFALSEKLPAKPYKHNAQDADINKLYVSDAVMNQIIFSQHHFDNQYIPKDSIQSIFEDKNPSLEIHFQFLDFNHGMTDDDVAIKFLPLYDFSKDGDIEDYKNSKIVCSHCFSLFKIKFPFF